MSKVLYHKLFTQNAAPVDAPYISRLDNKCFEVNLETDEVKELGSMGAVIRLGTVEGTLVGYWIGVYSHTYGNKDRHLIVSRVGVHPDFRRRGVAARLIEDIRFYGEGVDVGLFIPEYCLVPSGAWLKSIKARFISISDAPAAIVYGQSYQFYNFKIGGTDVSRHHIGFSSFV
jgi:GNAT superfamily N-acetyltransferase